MIEKQCIMSWVMMMTLYLLGKCIIMGNNKR